MFTKPFLVERRTPAGHETNSLTLAYFCTVESVVSLSSLVPRPSPSLTVFASDGKLGKGLGSRLGDGFLLYCRLRNLTEIDFTLKAAMCNYLTCTGFLATKLLREPLV